MEKYRLPAKPCGLPIKEAARKYPEFRKYLQNNRLNLGNPESLLLYNQLILRDFLLLEFTIPQGFLVPTICSRWSFIEWILQFSPINILEIGTGASAILALMLARIGCFVVATEIDPLAYESAISNIKLNNLESKISIIYSNSERNILTHLFESLDKFDAIVTNPPQYDEEYYNALQSKKGFSGQKIELVGGKKGHEFIVNLLDEVQSFKSPPKVYFQLTIPSLVEEINKLFNEANFNFSTETISIGTRQRVYYKIEL